MKILIITDAWQPQVNGVVRTLMATQKELTAMGQEVAFIGPDQFRTVAAYPEQAPREVIGDAPVGCLNEDLKIAALGALSLSPEACRNYAMEYSWLACTEQFVQNLVSTKRHALDFETSPTPRNLTEF